MRVEREFRKLEGIEELRIFDADEKEVYHSIPMEFDVEDIPVQEVMENIPADIHILIPHDEGKDFIIQNLGINTLKRANFNQKDVKGRLLSKFSPLIFETIYGYLFDVYRTGETKKIRLVYYINNKISKLFNVKIVFEMGKIFLIAYRVDPSGKGNFLDNRGIREDQANMIENFSQTGNYYRVDGEYIWSQGVYNIINRSKEDSDKYYNIVFDLVIPEDKHLVDYIFKIMDTNVRHHEEIIRINTHDGILKYIEVSIFSNFDEDGNFTNYQGLIKDITNYSMNKLIKPVDFLLDGFKNSKKLALMVEPLNVKQYEFSKGYYYLIEQDSESYQHSRDVINNIVEKSAIERLIKLADGKLDTFDETFTYNVGGNPDNQKIVELYIERFELGQNTHSIGFLSDITEKRNKQTELIEANEEKTILIKEVHHRVKNNLQILNSFLNLEKRVYSSNPKMIVDHMQIRLASLSLLHEKTYNAKDYKNINLNEYVRDYDKRILELFRLQNELKFESVVDENLNLTIEVITPLLLIIAELTSNSIEHAFAQDQSNKIINKRIAKIDEVYAELIFKDNGECMKDQKEIIKSFSCVLIQNLTKQLDGNISIIEEEDGIAYKLIFPIEMKHTMN